MLELTVFQIDLTAAVGQLAAEEFVTQWLVVVPLVVLAQPPVAVETAM